MITCKQPTLPSTSSSLNLTRELNSYSTTSRTTATPPATPSLVVSDDHSHFNHPLSSSSSAVPPPLVTIKTLYSDSSTGIGGMLPYATVTEAPEAVVFHQMATPLIEVFSVWIHNDVDNGYVPRKIFGRIHVIDGFRDSFTLYDRKYGESETVGGPHGDGTLSLCGPHCMDGDFNGMSPSADVDITVDLRDASHEEIVQGTLTTFYESPDCYDKPCVAHFGFATIYWTTLRTAVLATISISYVGEESDRVYGSLFAYYGEGYEQFCKADEEKYFRFTLFDEPMHEPAAIKSGTCLSLMRSVFAVPAHSSIVIRGCLWDADKHSQLVGGGIMAEFEAQSIGYSSLLLKNCIKVEVNFKLGQTLYQDG